MLAGWFQSHELPFYFGLFVSDINFADYNWPGCTRFESLAALISGRVTRAHDIDHSRQRQALPYLILLRIAARNRHAVYRTERSIFVQGDIKKYSLFENFHEFQMFIPRYRRTRKLITSRYQWPNISSIYRSISFSILFLLPCNFNARKRTPWHNV